MTTSTFGTTQPTPVPGKAARIIAWTMSGLLIAFLLFDGAIKLVPLQIVLDTSAQLGLPADPTSARILGVLTLLCALLYAIPRTAVLGAILLTAILAAPSPPISAPAARCSRICYSASIWGSSPGAACGFAIRGCGQ